MENHHQILSSVADGDAKAFRSLYDLYNGKVFNTAISYLQSEQDAEEVTQDVFTSIYRNAGKFKGQASVSTWIYRITVNASLNAIKKKKRNTFLSLSSFEYDAPDFDHPGIVLENKENARALFKAINALPGNQKTAFILSFIEDLQRQQVADIMETSLKAVESLLQRGKKNLRNILEKTYDDRRI